MKPICVPCKMFMRCKKNDYPFEEGFGNGEGKTYKLWLGDLWACPSCDAEIVIGVGRAPIAEHFEPNFEERRRLHAPRILVDDC